jgi:hypothetical protein
MKTRRVALLVLALLLVSCGTFALTVGQALEQSYQRFKSLDDRYNAALTAGVITKDEFAEWAKFSQKFNASWQKAKALYIAGGASGDVRASLDALQTELEIYLLKLAARRK